MSPAQNTRPLALSSNAFDWVCTDSPGAEGWSWAGECADGKPTGKGVMIHAEGHVFEGLFVAGRREGRWVERSEDGSTTEKHYGEAALGLTRADRRRIQESLNAAGFDAGVADGVFGPRTRRAIEDWQDARGDAVTGYLTMGQAREREFKKARFVCQQYDMIDEKWYDRVMVLDQLSVAAIDPHPTYGHETVDGRVVINPEHPIHITPNLEFRMRIYRDSLIQDKKTEKEIIDELVKREADRDPRGRVMDYTGLGSRIFANFGFASYEKFGFFKSIDILLDESPVNGILDTNYHIVHNMGDGFYKCRKPILLP